jgi:predicted glycogen debranching enzyme
MARPTMTPGASERMLRYIGDRVRFALSVPGADEGWKAFLRTNLGRAQAARNELIASLGGGRTFAGLSWRDIPLIRENGGWELDLPLTEVGWFRAKPYAVDPDGRQHWPDGDDVGVAVHPDFLRTANTIYCAFPRMFGDARKAVGTRIGPIDDQLAVLDKYGYTVIPPSGKLRDLAREVPHIVSRLGCRILHLLPITATPTTYARFGRFGSPYAAQDLTAIDPALAVFDRRTSVVDQFRELTYACHLRGARVLLDIVVNHTGWGSTLQNEHPEWFERDGDGAFHSPGAWGTTWEDLVELDNRFPELWEEFAEALLTWCRRGVDGFRCDAGYMVPRPAWQYIISRVRQEFPDTVFLLEGLGGAWDATATLLTEGGMQWAYSELFQNYGGEQVATYLDHCIAEGQRLGLLVHYSETHDNDRLAKRGPAWSVLRNRLAALACQSGAWGFTCGVEWLAKEKLEVHQSRGLNWDADENIVDELADLARLTADHPCFFDGAALERLSPTDSPVLALARTSADGVDHVLVLANTDVDNERAVAISAEAWKRLGEPMIDLLGDKLPAITRGERAVTITMAPAGSCCLSALPTPIGLSGEAYRWTRAQAAWAYAMLREVEPEEHLGPCDWRALATWVKADPVRFLASIRHLDHHQARLGLLEALQKASERQDLPQVARWGLGDLNRVLLVPPEHWLLVKDKVPFSATLKPAGGGSLRHARSLLVDEGHIACFPPASSANECELMLERFSDEGRQVTGKVRFLARAPDPAPARPQHGMALLTNGRGGMARLAVDLGAITSKYDCLLGANLHPSAPTDRHVFAKRVRVWINADGFITPLDAAALTSFTAGPPATWSFVAPAGDGKSVPVRLAADMLEGRNATVLRFARPAEPPLWGVELPGHCDVRLILRVDLEDRNFHWETRRSPEADRHFAVNTSPLHGRAGFAFSPAPDRQLRAWTDSGRYHHESEWCENIAHPVEASRGLAGSGDAWSPGWFELPLGSGDAVTLVVTADPDDPTDEEVAEFEQARVARVAEAVERAGVGDDPIGHALATAAQAYVVRRDGGRTVIAGYPWFLDWGRDTLIAARGLLAIGLADEVQRILATFARFEEHGTLPNMLNGDSAANRDTSDAPLWFGVACEELAEQIGEQVYDLDVGGRTLRDVLRAIAAGYLAGTPNGIKVDPSSGLVWSPPHFTWMDTNFPAGTPREGYPIEIQVLWIRLLRLLERLRASAQDEPWWAVADRATASLGRYWIEDRGYFGDALLAPRGTPAAQATLDNSLRPNHLFAVSLGVVGGERARRCAAAAMRFLVVPGALRSLAPLPVAPPLPIHAGDGRLLNDPNAPYWGRYEGDEDTRRKPAYHNGTAWTWLLPVFCEALARAWEFSPAAVAAAKAYLGSIDRLLGDGCIGQIPELVDGDAPHQQRGCDAQAWGVSEAVRAWKLLGR